MVSAGAVRVGLGAAAGKQQQQLGLLGGLSASRSERANRSHGGVIDTSQKHREAAAHEEARQTALDELSRPRASDPCLANDK